MSGIMALVVRIDPWSISAISLILRDPSAAARVAACLFERPSPVKLSIPVQLITPAPISG
jgi:hypothetical protein